MTDALQQLLRKRAVALAAPRAVAPLTEDLELIVFRAGARRYAIDASEAGEAIGIEAITPLPGVPPFYCGLIVHQGIVYPVVDIRPLTGAPFDEPLAPVHAILFASDERTIAIAADPVESFTRIDAATIRPTAGRMPAVRGTTPDGIVVLDVLLLLGDARLVIDDRSGLAEPSAGG